MGRNNIQKRVRAQVTIPVQVSPITQKKIWEDDNRAFYKTHIARSRDLSLNGIFVETSNRVPVGESCIIEIHIDAISTLEIRGEVIRHADDGMGIIFYEMNQIDYQILKEVVFDNVSERVKFLKQIQNSIGYKSGR